MMNAERDLKLPMNFSVLPASCRQKKLGSADETSAARWSRSKTLLRQSCDEADELVAIFVEISKRARGD